MVLNRTSKRRRKKIHLADLFTFRIRRLKRNWTSCTLKGRKDVKVIKERDVKNWHIEVYKTKDGKKGILIGSKTACILIPPEMPNEWKEKNIFENPMIPKYVKEELTKLDWVKEIL